MPEIKIIHDDCMNVMASYPDNYFDLACVDPPYGIGENGDRNKSREKLAIAQDYKSFHGGDVSAPDPEYFIELCRVSKNQIIWGANHFADRFDASGPGWIVWDKENGSNSFADAELASSSFDKAVRIYRYRWNGMIQGSHGNKRLNETRIHPTQKPVKLYQWLLANYAKPGDRILDTHLGSGSSAIAAHYASHDFVGIELDEDYYRAACERYERETAQADMFAGGVA